METGFSFCKLFLKQQTVGNMSDHEFFRRTSLGLVGTKSSCLKIINEEGVAKSVSWDAIFCENNIRGGASIPAGE